jgi:O-antigen biosynthesis protein
MRSLINKHLLQLFKGSEQLPISRKRVSAIVPNYNYAQYLQRRLQSINDQTHPLYEIIVIDDASTDNSVEVINRFLAFTQSDHRLVVNDHNSGSVFKQWLQGVSLAQCDYVWICEADDSADPLFVESVMHAFDDPQVVLSYSQSRQIDENERILANDYLEYTDDIDREKWRKNYLWDGYQELIRALAIKNTIPNVSAVIFRKEPLSEVLQRYKQELSQLLTAGDWLVYCEILRKGRINFTSKVLNSHRWHRNTMRRRTLSTRSMAEILYMQNRIAGTCSLSKSVREKARNYAQMAYEYLELPSSEAPDPVRHQEVRRSLDEISASIQASEIDK